MATPVHRANPIHSSRGTDRGQLGPLENRAFVASPRKPVDAGGAILGALLEGPSKETPRQLGYGKTSLIRCRVSKCLVGVCSEIFGAGSFDPLTVSVGSSG